VAVTTSAEPVPAQVRPGPVPGTPGAPRAFTDRQLLGLLLVLVAAPMLLMALYRYYVWPPGGDEPHYLVISQAIQKYHTLDVRQVYENGDYRSYYPMWLGPGPHVSVGAHSLHLPVHSIGGPILWLIPFMLLGRVGVMGFMLAVSLLTVANIYWLLRELNIDKVYAVIVTLAFGVGTPLLTYSSMVFVEPIGALGCVYALRVLHRQQMRRRDLLLSSAGLGALPWVHSRFMLFTVLLLGFIAYRIFRESRFTDRMRYVYGLGPAAVLLGVFEIYNLVYWHSLNPAANQASVDELPFTRSPVHGLVGSLLDQESGLLLNFPIFFFVLPGLLLTLRRRYALLHIQVFALVVPYMVIVCTFKNWHGGYSPPARMVVVLLPLLAFYVAAALQRAHNWLVTAVAGICVMLALGLQTMAMLAPRAGFGGENGHSLVLEYIGGLIRHNLTHFEPSSFRPGQSRLFAYWFAVVFGVAVVTWLIGRRHPDLDSPDAGTALMAEAA
jgi:hypothetical protein